MIYNLLIIYKITHINQITFIKLAENYFSVLDLMFIFQTSAEACTGYCKDGVVNLNSVKKGELGNID